MPIWYPLWFILLACRLVQYREVLRGLCVLNAPCIGDLGEHGQLARFLHLIVARATGRVSCAWLVGINTSLVFVNLWQSDLRDLLSVIPRLINPAVILRAKPPRVLHRPTCSIIVVE